MPDSSSAFIDRSRRKRKRIPQIKLFAVGFLFLMVMVWPPVYLYLRVTEVEADVQLHVRLQTDCTAWPCPSQVDSVLHSDVARHSLPQARLQLFPMEKDSRAALKAGVYRVQGQLFHGYSRGYLLRLDSLAAVPAKP